jgi:chemotaxis protein methyltransferase CheR
VTISPAVLRQAQALVAHRLGLHFPDGRMADMERGLAQALRNSSYPSLESYLAWVAAVPDDDPELRRLAAQLTIGETHFFRDAAAFEVLERHVLPSLLATRSGVLSSLSACRRRDLRSARSMGLATAG